MNWDKKQSTINNYCCWCRNDIHGNNSVYGLTAKFRKNVETSPVDMLRWLMVLVASLKHLVV